MPAPWSRRSGDGKAPTRLKPARLRVRPRARPIGHINAMIAPLLNYRLAGWRCGRRASFRTARVGRRSTYVPNALFFLFSPRVDSAQCGGADLGPRGDFPFLFIMGRSAPCSKEVGGPEPFPERLQSRAEVGVAASGSLSLGVPKTAMVGQPKTRPSAMPRGESSYRGRKIPPAPLPGTLAAPLPNCRRLRPLTSNTPAHPTTNVYLPSRRPLRPKGIQSRRFATCPPETGPSLARYCEADWLRDRLSPEIVGS